MSSQELDALIEQINISYKTRWEQARLVASAIGGDGIKFPWDNQENKPLTQEEFHQNYQDYFKHIDDKEKLR